jgi:hypothetical protein
MLTGGEQEEMDAKRYLEEVPYILYKKGKINPPSPPAPPPKTL